MFQLFVEGYGETGAAGKLVQKIVSHYKLGEGVFFSKGRRRSDLGKEEGLKTAVGLAKLDDRTEGLLILRDDEDTCPAQFAPATAGFLRSLKAPFPIAYCILYREFETLFVAYADEYAKAPVPHLIRGHLVFDQNMKAPADPESRRDAKGFLTAHLPPNKAYKPTTDQLSLTQALDIGLLSQKNLPCFGTLVRCIQFLADNRGTNLVYPG